MGDQVERDVTMPVEPEVLWDALTDPDALADWFGADVSWDVEPGGDIEVCEPDGVVRRGQVEEVVPGELLRFRWWPEDRTDQASEVTYIVMPATEGSRLVVVERPVAPVLDVRMSARASVASAEAWDAWDDRAFMLWAGLMRQAVASC